MNFERIALYFLILIFPLGQLLRFPFLGLGDITIHINDLAVGFISLLFILRGLLHKNLHFPRTGKLIVLFISFAIISIFVNLPNFSSRQIIITGLYLIRFISYSTLFFLIVYLVKSGKIDRDWVLKLLIFDGLIISLFGFVQYIFYPDLRPLMVQGWDPHYYRLVSTFFDPAFTGAILGFLFSAVNHNVSGPDE